LQKKTRQEEATFEQILRDYLMKLIELRRRGASEDSIRENFFNFIRTAFPRINAEIIELEHYVPGVRVKGGFIDALYGDLIFEFKRKLDSASHDEGKGQLASVVFQ